MEVNKLPKYWYTNYSEEIMDKLSKDYELSSTHKARLCKSNFIGYVESTINRGLYSCLDEYTINQRYKYAVYISNEDFWKIYGETFKKPFNTVYSLALSANRLSVDSSEYIRENIKQIYE